VIELVEEVPAERRLVVMAERIKRARLARGLTLQEVADRGDFSGAHLSQIERGQSVPSVGTLLSIASALDVPADYLLRDDDAGDVPLASAPSTAAESDGIVEQTESFRVVPAGGFDAISIAGGVQWARLTIGGPVEFVQARYSAGAASGEVAYQERGRQCGFVVEGTLLVELGFSRHVLNAGSSIVFDRAVPHRVSNPGDIPATAIWATLPEGS
jgi:transcriptional regulator with XRE-family HTH domain/mannose-6-phosphate isomerase-like protein (cupin superfamily)